MNSTINTAEKFLEGLSQSNETSDAKLGQCLQKKLKNKVMHGQYIRSIDKQLISDEDMFAVTVEWRLESEIVAAQDQALKTKYNARTILHTETDSKCRLCQQHHETIDDIISACAILAKEQYIKIHDTV
jgi:hypothetical protein